MILYLSRVHFPVTTLGPGNRIGIWFQGCSIQCPGCISVDTWSPRQGETTIDETVSVILNWHACADGVTISGGEPFDQPQALLVLLQRLRSFFDKDILVYSGYEFARLEPLLDHFRGYIDAIITGPYRESHPQSLPLRGSDNQELHILTERGKKAFSEESLSSLSRKSLDVMFDSDGVIWLAGIPARGDFDRLTKRLAGDGFKTSTSQQGSLRNHD